MKEIINSITKRLLKIPAFNYMCCKKSFSIFLNSKKRKSKIISQNDGYVCVVKMMGTECGICHPCMLSCISSRLTHAVDCWVTTDPTPSQYALSRRVTSLLISSRGGIRFSTPLNLAWPCLLWPVEDGGSQVVWVAMLQHQVLPFLIGVLQRCHKRQWVQPAGGWVATRTRTRHLSQLWLPDHEGGQLRLPAQPPSQPPATGAEWRQDQQASAWPTHRSVRES